MALYEHVYLARQDVSAQQVETMTEQFKTIIESMGGKVAKVEYWGVKSLAYRINKNRKAHFSLINLDAPAAVGARRPFFRRRKILPVLGPNAPKIDYKDVEAPAALHLRARQDRAVPHHRRLGQEAARAGASRSSAPASSPCCPT
jgi:ribosomal protein S6